MFNPDSEDNEENFDYQMSIIEQGRPERDKVISTDDILDLKISLEITGGVNPFLKELEDHTK